jgi:hypothetical protein
MNRLIVCITSVSLLAAAGCVNLGAVRDFSKESAATLKNQEPLELYVQSAERQASYDMRGAKDSGGLEERRRQSQSITIGSTILVRYFETLATLADESLTDFSKEAGSLTNGIQKLEPGLFTADEASAFQSLTQLVARAATDRARQHQLRRIVKEADPHVQTALGALRNIAGRDIKMSLTTEADAVHKYYTTMIMEARDAKSPRGLEALLRERESELIGRTQTEQKALDGYVSALETVAKGHRSLVTASSFSAKETIRQLKSYQTEIKSAAKAVQKL